jgi:ADP-ribosylglycohydrolase
MNKPMSNIKKVALGSIIGALIGDAAGASLEFRYADKEVESEAVEQAFQLVGGGIFALAPGQITDDGELTLSLLNALASNRGFYNTDLVAHAYLKWIDSRPFDVGNATSSALYVSKDDYQIDGLAQKVQARAAKFNKASQANGCLMRATPLAVAGLKLNHQSIIQIVKNDVSLTHPHPICIEATTAYVLAIRHLLVHSNDRNGAFNCAKEYLQGNHSEVFQWLNTAENGNLSPAYPQIGFIKHAFSYAFYHLKASSSYEDAIQDTLRRGGDTDTNACIVGGLIGACMGIDNISSDLVEKLYLCNPSLGLRNRPKEYHPRNVPELLNFLDLAS